MLETKHRRIGVFIDVQNMYYSARSLYGSKVNFHNIVKSGIGDAQLIRAIAYGITTKGKEETAFFEALHSVGIEVMTKELLEYESGHKKGDWDVGIAIDIVRLCDMVDVIVLVSGDGDYVPVGDYVKGRGRIFHVMSFRESTSSRLVECADIYTNLSDQHDRYLIGSGNGKPRGPKKGEASIDPTSVEDEADADQAVVITDDEHKRPRRFARRG